MSQQGWLTNSKDIYTHNHGRPQGEAKRAFVPPGDCAKESKYSRKHEVSSSISIN